MVVQAPVSRTSPLPLYYQLQEVLRSGIARGEWHQGQRIPTETELCARYRVSRITVRQAVTALVNEGLLYRSRGRGTYVAVPRVSHVVSELVSFTEEMTQRGLVATSRLLEVRVEEPSERFREPLGLGDGEKVIRIKRLRLGDGEPMALQTAYLSHDRFRNLEAQLREDSSLYRVLEEKFGVRLTRAYEVYRPIILGRQLADLLNVPPKSAAFDVERTTFDIENRPIEFVVSILRGDRLQLTLELVRK